MATKDKLVSLEVLKLVNDKADDLKSEIAEDEKIIKLESPIQLAFEIGITGKFVNYSTGDFTASSTYNVSKPVDISKYKRISYKRTGTTSSNSSAGIAFYDATKTFISNSGIRTLLSQDSTGYASALYTTDVPATAVYARFTMFADTVTYGEFAVYGINVIQDAFNDIETLHNDFRTRVENGLASAETIDLTSVSTVSGLINTSNKWSTSSGFYSYVLDIPEKCLKLAVTAGEANAIVGLLKNDTLVNNQTPPYCDGIADRIFVTAETTKNISIPVDCRYIVITKEASGEDRTPSSVVLYKWDVGSAVTYPLGLHEMPRNETALNIVKRCRQMTDIKWTPAVDLKRLMVVTRGGAQIPDTATAEYYIGKFKAGTEYTGVPYGRVSGTTDDYGISYGTVGHYIGFDTFVTSVSNPKSRLSDTDVSSASNHVSVIYATVCSGMTCYALNVNEVPTANIGSISGLNLIGKLNDNGVLLSDSMIKIGDVLNLASYHTAIITDIIRDSEGLIQSVEISEATVRGMAVKDSNGGPKAGGLCIRKGWTRSQLFGTEGIEWGNYSVYRYTGTVPYTPSPYVNVGDEFDGFRIEQYPIMPYEGEGFAYKTGYIPDDTVKLVITQDGYQYVRVFKGDTEITGSPFAVTSDGQGNISDISVSEIGAGNYTAYLCNISDGNVTKLTYACHWTVE